MEVFTPPPYREARPHGRPSKIAPETQILIAQKALSKEMTYREAGEFFGISVACVGKYVRKYKQDELKVKRNENVRAYNTASDAYRHEGQLKELKQTIGELYIENQLLKKIVNKSLILKKSNGSVITTENLDQLQKDVE